MTLDLGTVLGGLSLVGYLIMFWKFGGQLKDRGIAEGKHLEEINGLKKDLKAAHDRIRDLESSVTIAKDSITEIKGDIKYIMETVKEIKKAVNERWGGCV